MRNFHDTLETRKRSFIGTFPIYMIVPLISTTKSMVDNFANETPNEYKLNISILGGDGA